MTGAPEARTLRDAIAVMEKCKGHARDEIDRLAMALRTHETDGCPARGGECLFVEAARIVLDQHPDPLAQVEIGDDDPIGPYEPASICGATAYTGNRAGRMECLRDPHPEGWLHVSACDDQVDYVWRDLRVDELPGLVMTSEGVVCRVCNLEATTSGGHFAGCSAVSSAVPGEPTDA